jgi:hypothetical protein
LQILDVLSVLRFITTHSKHDKIPPAQYGGYPGPNDLAQKHSQRWNAQGGNMNNSNNHDKQRPPNGRIPSTPTLPPSLFRRHMDQQL